MVDVRLCQYCEELLTILLVLLAYREGLSREALGARFSRPPATIKSWLRRSLLQLRDCLGHDRAR